MASVWLAYGLKQHVRCNQTGPLQFCEHIAAAPGGLVGSVCFYFMISGEVAATAEPGRLLSINSTVLMPMPPTMQRKRS